MLSQQVQNFRISADKDRRLERRTLQQWQAAKQVEGKVDKRELGGSHRRIMDGKGLKQLYLQREAAEAKKKRRENPSISPTNVRNAAERKPISRLENARQFHLVLLAHQMEKKVSTGMSLRSGTVIWKLILFPQIVPFVYYYSHYCCCRVLTWARMASYTPIPCPRHP